MTCTFLLAFGFKVCHTVPADVLLLSESNFTLDNIVIRYKADFIEEELIKENLIEDSTEKNLNKE